MSPLEAIGMAVATGFGFGVGMKTFSLVDELVRSQLHWFFNPRHMAEDDD